MSREASEQKLGQKPKSELKEIELSYCHHSICLLKKSNYKIGLSKLDEKRPSYAHLMLCDKVASGLFCAN